MKAKMRRTASFDKRAPWNGLLQNRAHRRIRWRAIGALLGSLRPPDRDPPRLATLTMEQERVIVDLLDDDHWAPTAIEQRAKARP